MKRSFLIPALCAFLVLGLGRLAETFPRIDMVVLDSSQPNPKFVGFLFGVSQIGGSLPAPRVSRAISPIQGAGKDYLIFLRFTSQGLGESGPSLFFAQPDCQGPAYISEAHFDAELSAFDPHALRFDLFDPGKIQLYAAKRGAVLADFSMLSEWPQSFLGSPTGGCTNIEAQIIRAAVADLVDGDLTGTFVPPYRVIPNSVDN